jgi:hypothetical protein
MKMAKTTTTIGTTLEKHLEKQISKKSVWLRAGLSLFILYHVAVIAILANGGSFLGRASQNWMAPYANPLGLNVGWNFFAPDPAHTMFIQYFVRFENEEGVELKEAVEGFFPPEKEQIVIDTSKRRMLYAMRFLITDEKRMKVLLGPFLCRQYPGASTIHVRDILEPIPNLDLSQLGQMKEKEETLMREYTHFCDEPIDEVEL